MIFRSIEQVRRFFRILAGFTLLLIGVVMFFTPGPGWLVIFLGSPCWRRNLCGRGG